MKTWITFFLIGLSVISCGQQEDVVTIRFTSGGINNFLELNPDETKVIYSKNSEGFEYGDYIEGHIFIYDIINNSTELLSDETYEISSVQISWFNNKNEIFFFDGSTIFHLGFDDNVKVRPVYKPESRFERIEKFAVSGNEEFIACWISHNSSTNSSKKLVLIDWKNDRYKVIYEVEDKWPNEELGSLIEWSDDGSKLFIVDLNGDLIEIRIEPERIRKIDDNVETSSVESFGNYIFYNKSDRIIRRNLLNDVSKELMSSNGLTVHGIKSNGDGSLLLGFNNKVIYYNGDMGVGKTLYTTNLRERIVYFGDQFIVIERDDNEETDIYLRKVSY